MHVVITVYGESDGYRSLPPLTAVLLADVGPCDVRVSHEYAWEGDRIVVLACLQLSAVFRHEREFRMLCGDVLQK